MGLFITFEGIEACGKSTQIQLLRERLEGEGKGILFLREPGGTDIGEVIRDLVLHSKKGEGMSSETEILLYSASRAEIVRKKIDPALKEGRWVICDRFFDSTTVYQGAARQIPENAVEWLNRFAVGEVIPDLTFILDISPKVSRERIASRSEGGPDRIERENEVFFERVREGYLELAKREERCVLIDGTLDISTIQAQIWNEVAKHI